MKNYIWLFGENLGSTANNNSYYFWRYVVQIEDNIEKYYILEKNEENVKKIALFSEKEKKYVVWRNSIKHFRLYMEADMFFVTLSYRDVRPEEFFGKKYNFLTTVPVIYLQHGTSAMKRLGYNGKDYNNNMLRFVYYNPKIKDALIGVNGFKEYQLYNGQFHPRYQELIKRFRETKNSKNILWFITWREYFGDNFATKKFLYTLKKVLSNKELQEHLDRTNTKLRLCLHAFFDKEKIENLFLDVETCNIEWVHANTIDVMDELVQSSVLITDYSSVGFDFTLLNKPVVLFAPDFSEYSKKRKLYCELEEYNQYAICSANELVQTIVNENYGINDFFRRRLPEEIDFEYIFAGKHIERMYGYFKTLQLHRITFLGYNFFGNGGTVSATYALAEGLLEKGYCVQLISLKQNTRPSNPPYALNMKALYQQKAKTKTEKLKKYLFKNPMNYFYLRYDRDQNNLIPYAGYALKEWLNKEGSETVISTRDSLHPFLVEAGAERIKNKLYFYHCSATVFNEVFPELISQLKDKRPGKAIFVTEKNRQALVELFDFEPYTRYTIIGNTLASSQIIERDEIIPVEEKEIYSGVYLLRMSEERKDDINNLLEFGKYLRENCIDNIRIYVYGAGNYVSTFLDQLIINEVTDYIKYCGSTRNPKSVFKKYDAVVDFSNNQSFGMTYIEGVFNGKMVFCLENTGSIEVLKELPECFYHNYEELVYKIQHLPEIPVETLIENYDIMYKKYSREVITDKLLEYISEES